MAWSTILAAAGVALVVLGLAGLGVCIGKALAVRRADTPEAGSEALRKLAVLNMASLGIAAIGLAAILAGVILKP